MGTELDPADQELLDERLGQVKHFEESLGCFYRDGLWSRMDALYHGYTEMRNALRNLRGRERDAVYEEARKEFGHQLHIPHAYAIVETVLPALLSNRPRILVLPRNQASDQNVEMMRALLDAQSSRIHLELKLQSVVKSGLMYGLGVGKAYWLRHEIEKPKLEPASWVLQKMGHKWAAGTATEMLFDDPTFEPVPVRDFFWDPFAANIDGARWAAHRTWRDPAYVKARLEDPQGWNRIKLMPEDLESTNGSAERYRASVRGAFEAQSIPIPNPKRDSDIHEVIEHHDRGNIVTILDRQWVVSVVQNEAWRGRLPFHVYRPTEVLNQFVGKGEIEPVEDLQVETDMIRTDRRWSAAVTMNPPLFVQEGVVDVDNIKVGPGEINPVNGDPKDLIWQMDLRDVPQSGYRETAEIAADIVRTSGISDSFAGGEAGSQATATGIQLELARASARIQLKTRRAEIELVQPIGEHWAALNQWHIQGTKDVRTPAPPVMGEPERRWAWFQVTPAELAGEFEFEIEGGSTAPENVPQQRQDAQILMTMMQGPLGQMFDARLMAIQILEKMGLKNPESRLQDQQMFPGAVLEVLIGHLAELGMDPNLARQVAEASLHEVLDAQVQAAAGTDHGQGGQGAATPPEQGGAPPEEQAQAA